MSDIGYLLEVQISSEGLLNIIRTPEGYLLRVIKEKKEFSLPGDIFALFIQDNSGEIKRIPRRFDDDLVAVMSFIHYPFIVTKSGIDKWNIYHLPTGQSWIRDNVFFIDTGLKGLFAFEGTKIMEGKTRFQAISQPFDLTRRRIYNFFRIICSVQLYLSPLIWPAGAYYWILMSMKSAIFHLMRKEI